MDSSDEESLAGLTQVPSHKRDIDGNVKVSNPYDSSSDSDGGIFNFDGNLSPEPPAKEKRKNDVFAVHDVSADLFPTPPEETGAVANALQAPINGHSNTESSVQCDVSNTVQKCDEKVEKYVVDCEDISDGEMCSAMDDYEQSQLAQLDVIKEPNAVSLGPFDDDYGCYKKPCTEQEMEEYRKKRVSAATKTKILWACRAYDRWVDYRRKMYIGCINGPVQQQWCQVDRLPKSVMQPVTLSRDICDFIVEVRKESGEEYNPGTVYDLVLCISLYLEREYGIKRLTSTAWPKVRNTLDWIMFEKNAEGIGQRKERDFVSDEQEDFLWMKGYLGEDTPDKLRLTIFFLLGKHFGLRGRSEHRDLVRYLTSQIKIEKQNDSSNDIMLVYREFKSKTNQGGLTGRNVKKPRVAYAFPAANSARCPVRLFIKYVRFCPLGTDDSRAFYLRTNVNWMSSALWYTRQPIGKGQLNDYLKNLMAQAGFVGHYTNHSLRATTATRLFQKNCPEQLIAEQTGHTSNAIRRYKKSSLAQKKDVSKLLAADESASKVVHETVVQEVKAGQNSVDKIANSQAEEGQNSGENIANNEPQNATNLSTNVRVDMPKEEDNAKMAGLVNIHFHFSK